MLHESRDCFDPTFKAAYSKHVKSSYYVIAHIPAIIYKICSVYSELALAKVTKMNKDNNILFFFWQKLDLAE